MGEDDGGEKTEMWFHDLCAGKLRR